MGVLCRELLGFVKSSLLVLRTQKLQDKQMAAEVRAQCGDAPHGGAGSLAGLGNLSLGSALPFPQESFPEENLEGIHWLQSASQLPVPSSSSPQGGCQLLAFYDNLWFRSLSSEDHEFSCS